MYSYPNEQEVIDDLGDKFIHAFVESVDSARDDLESFRSDHPAWFINFSKRFVANFIHERLWDAMTRKVSDHPDVTIVDAEPTRQILFGASYTFRFKRHSDKLKIEAYPTSGALAFWTNRATAPALPGLETWTLAMGYIWEPDLGEIGDTILSFRDGKDKPIWSITLRNEEGGASTGITWAPVDPTLPQLDLSDVIAQDEESTEGS